VPALRSAVFGTLAYRSFSADGTEYSFDSSEVEIAFESELPAQLLLAAAARYVYRPYRHGTTYDPPGRPERTEHDWRTELSLRRPVWRQLSLETRWLYQRNRSTADVFDYTRHVAGLYASWTLNP
jgi:Surface lipoprotein assembly modifier